MIDQLPQVWATAQISEICDVPKEKGIESVTPYLEIGNVSIVSKDYTLTEKLSVKGCRIAMRNDVLVSKVRPTRGAITYVREEELHISSAFTVLRNKGAMAEKYLWMFLAWNHDYLNHLGENCTGTMYPTVSDEVVVDFEVPLAPLNEQRRIVAKLEKLLQKVDTCKERLDKIPTILKRFRQSILAAACSGRFTEDWREKNPDVEPTSLLLKRIREEREKSKSEPFGKGKSKREKVRRPSFEYLESNQPDIEIPLSWKWCRIADLIKDLTDYHANGSYETLKQHVELLDQPNYAFMIRATNFVKNNFSSLMKYITKDAYEFLSKSKLFGEEILVGKIGNAGDVYYMPVMNHPCSLGMNLFALRFPQLVNSRYIYFHLKTVFSSKDMKSYIKGATNQSIDKKSVRSIWIACPPKREQEEIIRRAEALFKIADQIEERYTKARTYVDKLTQSILAKAFRGELVPQDPNDELAAELLKRIKEERMKKDTKGNLRSGKQKRAAKRSS